MTIYPFPQFPDSSHSFKLPEPVPYCEGIEVEVVWAPTNPSAGNQQAVWSATLGSSVTGHEGGSPIPKSSTATNDRGTSSRVLLPMAKGTLEDQEECDVIVVTRKTTTLLDTLNQDALVSKVGIPSARAKKWTKVMAQAHRDADFYGNGWVRVSRGNVLERVDPRHVFVVDEERPQYAIVTLSVGGSSRVKEMTEVLDAKDKEGYDFLAIVPVGTSKHSSPAAVFKKR